MSQTFLGEAALTTEGSSTEWGAALSCWPPTRTAPGGQADWPVKGTRVGHSSVFITLRLPLASGEPRE